jgi:aminoglycoside phosphotransferase (APT) family kinase protein
LESITKNRQLVEAIRAMVGRAYGLDQIPPASDSWVSEMEHGWFNVAYHVRLRGGSNVVLKIAPAPGVEVMTYERGAMATELAALRLISRQTDVPVPAVDFADQTHELCNADYFFMQYIEAENLGIVGKTLPPACQDAYHEAVGAANRKLNAIPGPAFGPLVGPGSRSWRVVFTGMLEDVLHDGERRHVDLGWGYDMVRDVVGENAGCLDSVVEPRYVEWDLWDSNVMIRDGAIASIIDHERAFYGDPLIEGGFVATELPAFGDSAAFMNGYGQGKLTETELTRRRLYSLYLVLIMIIETVYRGHSDTKQYDWARERMTEVMSLLGRRAR